MTKLKINKIKAFYLFDGYVESNMISGVPIYHHEGFYSIEEALESIGKAILKAYNPEFYLRRCCKEWKDDNPKHSNCPQCGNKLHRKLTTEDGLSIFSNFLNGTIDSIGESWEDLEKAGWIFGAGVIKNILCEDFVVEIFECSSELLWYASQDKIDREGMGATFRATLKQHVDVGHRKGLDKDKIHIKIYKDMPL